MDDIDKELEDIWNCLDDEDRRELFRVARTARTLPPPFRSIFLKVIRMREEFRLFMWNYFHF